MAVLLPQDSSVAADKREACWIAAERQRPFLFRLQPKRRPFSTHCLRIHPQTRRPVECMAERSADAALHAPDKKRQDAPIRSGVKNEALPVSYRPLLPRPNIRPNRNAPPSESHNLMTVARSAGERVPAFGFPSGLGSAGRFGALESERAQEGESPSVAELPARN